MQNSQRWYIKGAPTESDQCQKVHNGFDTNVSLTARYFMKGFKTVHKHILRRITYLIRPIMCSSHDYLLRYTTLIMAWGNLKNTNLTINHT